METRAGGASRFSKISIRASFQEECKNAFHLHGRLPSILKRCFLTNLLQTLHPIVAAVITKLIADLNRVQRITCIVVSHAVEEAMRIADKIVILYLGKVLAQGTPQEIKSSLDPLVQQFITGSPDGPISFHASSKEFREDLLVE